jgi:uncharacterized repeat protein (TIGR02543 family)
VGQTAISLQASKSVVLSTGFANSIVIASHGMGGDGNTANVSLVNATLPLIERSAQQNGGGSLWDGHVTATALVPVPATATYAFNGGNTTGSHTIAAEFLAAEGYIVIDTTPPTLTSITDNVEAGPVVAFNGVTYTVTFNEPVSAATVNVADFGNGGSAPVTVNSVDPTGNPAVYTVSVTPTGAGSLTLAIVSGATITDLIGNSLVTTSALPDDTTITVNHTYTLTAQVVSSGSITGSGQHPPGITVALTAVPNPGYRFTGWTGDASGADNPLTITMDADKTVGATFEKDLSDSDSDGLTAYDELVTYDTNPALADTDGDGLNDGYELGVGRFSIVPGSFTWLQARTDARSKGADLASFPTEDRWNRALQNLAANPFEDFTGLWIGASDAAVDGSWAWVNGESFNFAPWGTGRPSSTTGNTLDFAEVSGGGGSEIGKWYDRSSTTIRDGYLLETGYATSPTVADADGDGLNDGQEQTAGTSPTTADTDGDGLSDGQEINLTGTNPKLADTNGDGTNDAASDQDGDGLANLAEIATHGTDPLKADTDGDGLSDGDELSHPGRYFTLVEGSFTHAQAAADAATRRGRLASFPNANDFNRMAGRARKATQGYLWFGLSDATTEGTWLWSDGNAPAYTRWLNGQPDGGAAENHAVLMETTTQWADAVAEFVAAGYLFERVGLDPLAADTDGDGLSDGAESNTHQTNPVLDDSDSDGLTDGAEINTHGSNPKLADTDGDGLSDFTEVVTHGTNPATKDSDADGFDDLFEINTGFNPTLDSSTPDALSTIRTAVEFRFNAGNGASYRIEGSTDLQTWETVETDIIGTGGVVTRFYSIENQPKRYFRVKRN